MLGKSCEMNRRTKAAVSGVVRIRALEGLSIQRITRNVTMLETDEKGNVNVIQRSICVSL